MRKVLEITFAGDTFNSTVVGSADDALSSLRSNPPQIAVVDGALAGTNGYDLCKQIKTVAPSVRVLLLSSKQRPYDAAKGTAAGVDDHFDKPYDSTKFLDKIDKLGEGAAVAPAAVAPAAVAPAAVAPAAVAPAAVTPAAVTPAAARPAAVRAPVAAKPAAAPLAAQRPQAPPSRVASAAPAVATSHAAPAARPAAVAPAAVAVNGMQGKLQAMGLTSDQVQGVLALSRAVLEEVVWEVVPALAETLIKEEIARLTSE